ncbi:MAG: HEAT repeat domain-containing protein [Planctomycetaceae bacterium]|nr:HEAT repeat domain-containing protein [Planctomycetaceae bacterium]
MTRLTLIGCLCLLSAIATAEEEPLRTTADRIVDIEHIRLDLAVDLEQQTLTGTATIDFSALQPTHTLRLDAVDHDVQQVSQITEQNRLDLTFENTGDELQIDLGQTLSRGSQRRVAITYSVTKPPSGLHFFKPTDEEPDVPWMAWTQGEPRHNRYWFPCVDHPSEQQTTEIIAAVSDRFRVLSNGKLIDRRPLADDIIRYHWRQDKPHASYLVTLVVGEFAIVEQRWRDRPITYYVPPEQEADALRSFGRTVKMLDFFSEKFGIEYPWDQYAQVVVEQFTSGGMENTSATTMYDGVIHDERALLTNTPDRLIAHELGHQWWGDLVTCKDWSHLWLNEGFATYCEVLWWEHALGRDEADYLLWQKSKLARTGSTQERPIVDRFYPAPRTMFDYRVYPKAGWVLHMLRHRVGDDAFFQALQRYGTVYAYQTAETSDLRKVFSELTGLSLERFFYDWTERPKHPVLDIDTSWQADDGLIKVVIKQTQDGDPFHFPLKLELVTEDTANSVTLERDVSETEMTLYVPMRDRPRLIRVDPDYALLAEINETKSDDWWQTQLTDAPSIAERIRAVEHFAGSNKESDRKRLIDTLNTGDFYGVRIEAAKALGITGGDTSRDALIAGLKAENAKVRLACAEALGEFSDDESVAAALQDALQRDEPSYYVRASVIDSLSEVDDSVDPALFKQELATNSHRQVIQQSALSALGTSHDLDVLGTLDKWTRPGHYRNCRISAIKAMANFLVRNDVSRATETQTIERLSRLLSDDGTHIRRASATALGAIGKPAASARERLEVAAQHDVDQRVRDDAKSALTAIREGNGDGAEVKRLREQLTELRDSNTQLEDRLLKLESR